MVLFNQSSAIISRNIKQRTLKSAFVKEKAINMSPATSTNNIYSDGVTQQASLYSTTQNNEEKSSPNRMTSTMNDGMCSSQLSTYARCVLSKHKAGELAQNSCQAEFSNVKECLKQSLPSVKQQHRH